jgi:hypothetical protein
LEAEATPHAVNGHTKLTRGKAKKTARYSMGTHGSKRKVPDMGGDKEGLCSRWYIVNTRR